MAKNKPLICNLCGAKIFVNDPIVIEFHKRVCNEWANGLPLDANDD